MVHEVPLFSIPQNKALVKIHKTDRLYTPGSGSYTACFIVKISQNISILDFIVANYLNICPIFRNSFWEKKSNAKIIAAIPASTYTNL